MRGSPRDFAQRPLPSMMMAMWRGTVFVLADIVAVLTVRSCGRKANVTGGKSEPKLTEPQHSSPSAAATKLQDDCLPACGADAHHGEFCTGQFGDVSDIFSRGRRKLRKFACSVRRRVPASDFFVDRLAIGQLSCVTRRNIQPFSV